MLSARRRHGLAIAAILAAAGAVGARADAPGQQSRAESSPIEWSHNRLLVWTDYAGLPDVTSSAAALTVYRLTYREDCASGRYHFSVLPLFQPSLSWVKGSALFTVDGRTKLLAHEQGHFDLSEVGARKIRRVLSRLSEPCQMTSDERKALAMRGMREDTDAQAGYDRDTDFGLNEKGQTRALLEIARQLKGLADFATTAAPPKQNH